MPSKSVRTVELTWQEGGNDGRFNFFLSVPHGNADQYAFQAVLKNTSETMQAEAEKPVVPKEKDEAKVVKLFPPKSAANTRDIPADSEFDVVSLGDFVEPEGALAAAEHGESANASPPDAALDPFVQQTERVQEFIKLCLRYVNVQGELKRVHCLRILNETCGVGSEAVKTVFDSLVATQHLMLPSNPVLVKLGDQWCKRYLQPAPSKTPPAAKAAVVEKGPENSHLASLKVSIADLTRKLEAEATFRKRLLEITNTALPALQKRREALDAEVLKLEEERGRLAKERNSISEALENPEFAKARKELGELKEMFGMLGLKSL